MSVDESIASEVLSRWQSILRLRDWDIRLELVTESWRKSGDIKVDAANKLAVLLLNQDLEDDLEETVLHELIHLKLHGLDRMIEDLLSAVYGTEEEDPRRSFAYSQFMDRLESTAQDLTKALFAAGDRKTEATSRLLRDSIAREVSQARPGAEAT